MERSSTSSVNIDRKQRFVGDPSDFKRIDYPEHPLARDVYFSNGVNAAINGLPRPEDARAAAGWDWGKQVAAANKN